MKALDPFNIDLEHSTLIEASAGTGKTYTIATLFCLLVAKGYPVESILVVTFTEAAAAELKLRIRSRLSDTLARLQTQTIFSQDEGDKKKETEDELTLFLAQNPQPELICRRLSVAIACFDQSSILTIHSFCLKVLKENAFESSIPFDLELMPDRTLFLNQVCHDFFMTQSTRLAPLFLKFMDSQGVSPENFADDFSQVVSRPDIVVRPIVTEHQDIYEEYREVCSRIKEMLNYQLEDIKDLLLTHPGIKKQSYSKRYVPKWLEASREKIAGEGSDIIFRMTEKGDALYKFTNTRLAEKTKAGQHPPEHLFFDACERLLELNNLLEKNLIHLKLDFLAYFRQSLEINKAATGTFFFDDLVNDLCAALRNPGSAHLIQSVRNVYQACLIDEFQDTDPSQYEIFARLFSSADTPFFMIGDPKQAIYAFRGGDIFAYLKAAQDSYQQFTLDKNYRSAPLMVNAVNEIFSYAPAPFIYEQIGFSRVETPAGAFNRMIDGSKPVPPLQFTFIPRTPELTGKDGYISKRNADALIPGLVADDISLLTRSNLSLSLESGSQPQSVSAGDIAVLVRTNEQAFKIQKALEEKGIPACLSKSGSVYDSAEAVGLYDILRAVLRPDSLGALKAALCSTVYNYTAEQIVDLDRDTDEMFLWQDRFRGYREIWEDKGFSPMIMALFHGKNAFLKPGHSLSERVLTNYYHLVELISGADAARRLAPHYLLKWYVRQLSKQFRDEAADELRLDSDREAVNIVTIHKSKGLEYPVVYLPYLWEGKRQNISGKLLFHDTDNHHALTLDLGSEDLETARELMLTEDQAEQRRLLYVALTRASALCRIFWAGVKNVETSSLGSILHPGGCATDETMILDLNSLHSHAPKSIVIREPEERRVSLEPKPPSQGKPVEFSCLEGPGQIRSSWKISSFSSLTRGAPAKNIPESSNPEKEQNSDKILLADFPKGPRAGDAFHYIFENIDFTDKPDHIASKAISGFETFGFTDSGIVEVGVQAIQDTLNTKLDTPLGKQSDIFSLKDINQAQKLTEMEFLFPVNQFDIHKIQKSMEMSNESFLSSGYCKEIATLDIHRFSGFLKGFIDLVVCHRDRWYILDYKTNFLGTERADYADAPLFNAMAHHHYILQYHIYLAALHRYLQLRMKNYAYDTHFGGVFYLFIRGMNPGTGSSEGIYFHRPPLSAVEYLLNNLS